MSQPVSNESVAHLLHPTRSNVDYPYLLYILQMPVITYKTTEPDISS